MLTIEKPVTATYEVQKSKFICMLFPITDRNMVETRLMETRKQYPNATHYCYAYILDNEKRFQDDGEPTGTAGMPILNVLEKQNLHFVLCIVVRFFGGILLGTGGLVRAYTTSVTNALLYGSYINMVKGKDIQLIFSYENQKYIDSLLKKATIYSKEYQEQIQYDILISNENWDIVLEPLLPYLMDYQIVKDCYCMEKSDSF